jgi:phage shock protein A
MTIVNRLQRLLVSDVHAVLERIEEPALILRQSIREMEEVLQSQRHELARCEARRQRLTRRGEELHTRIAELDEQLDASIKAQRMDTARNIVRRKLEVRATGDVMAQRTDAVQQQIATLQQCVAERSAELEALKEKVELFGDDEPASTDTAAEPLRPVIGDQDVEAALLSELERRAAR